MLQKSYFSKTSSREDIIEKIKKEGFDPLLISDEPNYTYPRHKHPETKLLVCLEGSMRLAVDGKKYDFEKGDKIVIPGNTYHSAIVGDKGCVFFWSEKII